MPGSDLRFLVVEDHELERKVLVHLLRQMGAVQVHGAGDGRAALQVMHDAARPVDIVVTDLAMPGMDGMEFIRHLSDTGDPVSVILASALDRELLASVAAMAQAYRVNLLGVIGKPPTAGKLAPLIEMHRLARTSSFAGGAPVFSFAEIAQAWSRNEFEAWFSPKVDLATHAVRGMHATARWRHPERGLLEPAVFMPSMRARGLHDDFVWLMLQMCVQRCAQWQAGGLDLPISLNLSFTSLTDVNLARKVRQVVDAAGLEPRSFVLGFNEASLSTDTAKALENFARLRVDGFGVALDDFGSGAMSIDQFSLVAFTELKIATSFVAGTGADTSTRVGLALGLQTGDKLKLRTVADGIASEGDWNLLHDWGCELGQGPYVCGPLEADAVPAWVAQRSCAVAP